MREISQGNRNNGEGLVTSQVRVSLFINWHEVFKAHTGHTRGLYLEAIVSLTNV